MRGMALWKTLDCSSKDLQLLLTLSGGQSFRWHKTEEGVWTGVFAERIWTLKQTDSALLYQVQHSPNLALGTIDKKGRNSKKRSMPDDSITVQDQACLELEDERLLREYFRLDESLDALYCKWSEKDPNFKEVAIKFHGVRMLKQDPMENIFSFICSSNNNISRISGMVEKMCTLYGPTIGTKNGKMYHSFPRVDCLAEPKVEQDLRNAGFGYRAKFIQKSAAKIVSLGGHSWLQLLQEKPYKEAKESLMQLPGVGAKVADCICLMSLNHLEAIPVDTHVWQISCRYLPHLKTYKSVTEKVYSEIGEFFRGLYGPYAGWAHTVLFCADLKIFQEKSTERKRKADKAESKKEEPKRKKKNE